MTNHDGDAGADRVGSSAYVRAESRPLTFDLLAERDVYFVLTDALRDFVAKERSYVADGSSPAVDMHARWADTGDAILNKIEAALDGDAPS